MSEVTGSPARNATLFWCSLALIVAAILSGMAEPLLMLRRLIPLDPNEGWNAFYSSIAMAGGDLYPGGATLITNNYPPLSFYVVGIVGLVTGDNVLAGRIVALISMLVVALNIYYWLRAAGSEGRIALLGAATFLAFAATYGQAYVAMDDPQWLAHAIMTTGLVVLWRGKARTRAIVAASILMVAAGWTKHLLIPIPIAVTIWLMRRSTAAFVTWIVSSGIVLAASCLVLLLAYGEVFFDSLWTARLYLPHQSLIASAMALKCLAPIVGLSLLLCVAERSERATFVTAYLIGGAAVGGLTSGGAGVDVNAFFDLIISASMGAALTIEMLRSGTLQRRLFAAQSHLRVALAPIAIVLLGVCTAAYAVTKIPRAVATLTNLDALEKRSLDYVRQIRSQGHGQAVCETVGFCYWANSAFTVDLFIYGQKMQTGALTPDSCKSVFRGSAIRIIQLQSVDRRGVELLPAQCSRLIYENYRPIAESDLGVLLVPRSP